MSVNVWMIRDLILNHVCVFMFSGPNGNPVFVETAIVVKLSDNDG